MASQITQGTTVLGFTYNTDHQRLKQCIGGCTSPTTTVLYLNNPITGAGSEKAISGSTVVWHDYIVADGGIVAERTNNIGVISMQYFVLDHLGSTAALTDTAGNTLEQDYYDPWGKRRNANGSADTTCAITSTTTRGFSGHEMLDSVCLTNMNARLYDQQLGRFLSADSMTPAINDGQNLNRYSYVNNRPSSLRDPTGHLWQPPGHLTCEDCASSYGIGGYTNGNGGGGSTGGRTQCLTATVEESGVDGPTEMWGCIMIFPDDGGGGGESADGNSGGSSGPGTNKQNSNCDPDTVSTLNKLYKFGGALQDASETAAISVTLFGVIPGAQPIAGALDLASGAVFVVGMGIQAAAGWEISAQTGDTEPLRNSLIGAAMDAADVKEPYAGLANGISGDVLDHHQASCPSG